MGEIEPPHTCRKGDLCGLACRTVQRLAGAGDLFICEGGIVNEEIRTLCHLNELRRRSRVATVNDEPTGARSPNNLARIDPPPLDLNHLTPVESSEEWPLR